MGNARRKRRSGWTNKDTAELVGNGILILVITYFGRDRVSKVIFYSLFALGMLFVAYKIFRYVRVTRPLGISGVDEMNGTEFEILVQHLLTSQGYQVKRVGGKNDLGIDLIASNNRHKHAIQVKRWNTPVGMDAIRAAVAGKVHYQCDRAVVITNSSFSWRAKKLASANECALIDRNKLATHIRAWQISGVHSQTVP